MSLACSRPPARGKKDRVRVACIGTKGYPFTYSGYETLLKKLIPYLKDDFEIHIYCHRSLFPEKPPHRDGVCLHYIPAIETKYLSHLSHGMLSSIHALLRQYDVYFYLNSANGIFGILTLLLKKNSVLHLDGIEWKRPEMPAFAKAFFFFSAKIGSRTFDRVIADSSVLSRYYRRTLRCNPVEISYGAETDCKVNSELLSRYKLIPDEYILVVARLVKSNNIDFLIQEFCQSNSHRQLVIVGDFPFRDRYAESLKNKYAGNVSFLGLVADEDLLIALYTHCFAYLHGHSCGGTNPGLLSALAAGCLTLAIDTPFNREVLCEQKAGLLFKRRTGSLTTLINALEKNPSGYEEFKHNAIQLIETKYRWSGVAEQYRVLFQSVSG